MPGWWWVAREIVSAAAALCRPGWSIGFLIMTRVAGSVNELTMTVQPGQ